MDDDTTHLILWGAPKEMRKRRLHVLGEARRKDVLLRPELVPGLAHYRVNDIDSGHFVRWKDG